MKETNKLEKEPHLKSKNHLFVCNNVKTLI